MLKELTIKEVVEKVLQNRWFVFYDESKNKVTIISLSFDKEIKHVIRREDTGVLNNYSYSKKFYIEAPDEYRYMTQQEANDFVCLNIVQAKLKSDSDECVWGSANAYSFNNPNKWLYRTIQEIDGKIVYGEPQEFKVRVQS